MAPVNLYFDDPYKKEFETVVTKIEGNNVELQDTWFFPQGGGQTGDTGSIGNEMVVNVISENDRIIHILAQPPAFNVGDKVKCIIDWEKRYRKMRLHSASHIVYYLMREVFGPECGIASSGLLDELKERSDYTFNAPLDKVKLKEVEDKANALIAEGHEIRAFRDPGEPGLIALGNGQLEDAVLRHTSAKR